VWSLLHGSRHATRGVAGGYGPKTILAPDARSESMATAWPDIPYEPWRETCKALHRYAQIVGKYRLARTPWVNHSWHATLYVNARGFTTSLVPDDPGSVEIVLDLLEHACRIGERRANRPVRSRLDVGLGLSRPVPRAAARPRRNTRVPRPSRTRCRTRSRSRRTTPSALTTRGGEPLLPGERCR
jgi:hypothetical protein